jgi:DnaJ-class molecular chaperone
VKLIERLITRRNERCPRCKGRGTMTLLFGADHTGTADARNVRCSLCGGSGERADVDMREWLDRGAPSA